MQIIQIVNIGTHCVKVSLLDLLFWIDIFGLFTGVHVKGLGESEYRY